MPWVFQNCVFIPVKVENLRCITQCKCWRLIYQMSLLRYDWVVFYDVNLFILMHPGVQNTSLVKKGTRWSNLHKYKSWTDRWSNRSWSFVNSALFIFRVTRTSIALLFTWMRVKAIHTSCWLKEMTCSLSCLQLVSVQHFMLNRVEPSVSVGWAHWWEISYCSNIAWVWFNNDWLFLMFIRLLIRNFAFLT